jgi:GTP diphosphokinase / guanosine-3',5'-bis(diphosphate) 3'-diphosphatase
MKTLSDVPKAEGLPCDLADLLIALDFAARKHRDQRRKDPAASPYINHPIAVAKLLAGEAGVTDLVTLQAAILHDTVEDTDTTRDELVALFGATVADVVMEVTDDKSISDVRERKRLQRVHAPTKSLRAAQVKIADKTCNLRDIAATPPHNWSLQRKQEYFDWAKSVVDALPKVDGALLELFEATYAKREALVA